MIKILVIILVSLQLFACEKNKLVYSVPMTMLLSNPEKFDGEKVSVVGYLGRGGDVYLTEEQSQANDRTSALLLNIEDEQRIRLRSSRCRDQYVEVVGVFGLVSIKGLAARIGIDKVISIKHQETKIECVEQ